MPGTSVLSLPAAHRNFYNDVVVPHGKALQRAHLELDGWGFAVDIFLDQFTEEQLRVPILEAINWGVERWNTEVDDDERIEWLERGFNIEGAQDFVAMPWFRPDEWLQNLKLLQPVVVDRPTDKIRNHVHHRLLEIYRAFAFGLWMAAIALSRSLIEFSIKTNAKRLDINVTYLGSGGRTEDKSLKQLGEEVGIALPELRPSIEIVRDTGNRILHPKKHDVISHPKVMREEALKCIQAARVIVEKLYSVGSPPPT